MVKTFYAVELTVFEVVADVNHNDVSIDPAKTKRSELASAYNGSFTKAEAMAIYDAFTHRPATK